MIYLNPVQQIIFYFIMLCIKPLVESCTALLIIYNTPVRLSLHSFSNHRSDISLLAKSTTHLTFVQHPFICGSSSPIPNIKFLLVPSSVCTRMMMNAQPLLIMIFSYLYVPWYSHSKIHWHLATNCQHIQVNIMYIKHTFNGPWFD